MEKKHTDKKNYLSVRIKWCALLAAGLIGAVLVEMWTVCIREMRPFTIPAAFTVLFVLLAAAVHRLVLVPYRETRKIYEQFVNQDTVRTSVEITVIGKYEWRQLRGGIRHYLTDIKKIEVAEKDLAWFEENNAAYRRMKEENG